MFESSTVCHKVNQQNADERKRANDLKEKELRKAGVVFDEDAQ